MRRLYARDCSQWRHKLDKTEYVGYLLLISLAGVFYLTHGQTAADSGKPESSWAVRSGYCSDGLKRDQVDNSRCFPLWTFQSFLSLAKPAKS